MLLKLKIEDNVPSVIVPSDEISSTNDIKVKKISSLKRTLFQSMKNRQLKLSRTSRRRMELTMLIHRAKRQLLKSTGKKTFIKITLGQSIEEDQVIFSKGMANKKVDLIFDEETSDKYSDLLGSHWELPVKKDGFSPLLVT